MFWVSSLLCRGTWLIELVAELYLRPPLFFEAPQPWYAMGMICCRTVDVSTAVAPVGTRWVPRFVAMVVVVNSPRSYDGLIASGVFAQ